MTDSPFDDEAAQMRRAAVRHAVRDHFESMLERYEMTSDPAPYKSRARLVEAMALAYEEVGLPFDHGLLTKSDYVRAWNDVRRIGEMGWSARSNASSLKEAKGW